MPLPPEDRQLSPYTGWTREHWEATADGLLAAVRPYASPGRALIDLPGDRPSWSGRRSDAFEGFARTFLLAALRIAGAGADPHGVLEDYARGLDAGTRTPTSERDLADGDRESWPPITDRGQAMVEAAPIAFALRLTRPWLWDRLDGAVRGRVGRWLADALRRAPNDNNWHLFPLSVGGFLAEGHRGEGGTGRGAPGTGKDRALPPRRWLVHRRLRPRAFDHYNGWAFHLYPVLHAHLAGDAPLLAEYGSCSRPTSRDTRTPSAATEPPSTRAARSPTASPPPPPCGPERSPATPPSPHGTTRRLASGALRHFLDRGALDANGLLTLGWYGPEPRLVQPYSGPASPYWAASAFTGLLLPAGHPVWREREMPAPAEIRDTVLALPRPGWLVQSTARDGLVRLHNHGSDDQLKPTPCCLTTRTTPAWPTPPPPAPSTR